MFVCLFGYLVACFFVSTLAEAGLVLCVCFLNIRQPKRHQYICWTTPHACLLICCYGMGAFLFLWLPVLFLFITWDFADMEEGALWGALGEPRPRDFHICLCVMASNWPISWRIVLRIASVSSFLAYGTTLCFSSKISNEASIYFDLAGSWNQSGSGL